MTFIIKYYSNIFHILNALFVFCSGYFFLKSSKILKAIIILIILSVFMDLAAKYYAYVFHTNIRFYNYWILFYYSIISLLYIYESRSTKNILIFYISILIMILIWGIVDLIFIQGKIPVFISYFILPISLFISIQAYINIKKSVEQIDIPILKNDLLFFNIANLIYFPGSIASISTINYFSAHNSTLGSKLYIIHQIIYSIWFFVILLGLIINKWK